MLLVTRVCTFIYCLFLKDPVDRSIISDGQETAKKVRHTNLALQRLEDKKWISAKWGVSENNRKARFYSLTAKGRQQLVEKTSEWQRLTRAMGLILDGRPSSEEA